MAEPKKRAESFRHSGLRLGRDTYEKARQNMVNGLARRGIRDKRVLLAMGILPRHLFVEEALIPQAYNDNPLPIGNKQTITQPYMVALMAESLCLKGAEKVLEIGGGTGYQTALLSMLARKVYSVERVHSLLCSAKKNLDSLSCSNAVLRYGDGTLGWGEEAPFDAIIVSAVGPDVPRAYIDQLGPNGVIVMPVGVEDSQELLRVRKTDGRPLRETISPCRFVRLVGRYGF